MSFNQLVFYYAVGKTSSELKKKYKAENFKQEKLLTKSMKHWDVNIRNNYFANRRIDLMMEFLVMYINLWFLKYLEKYKYYSEYLFDCFS
jgi:hypothetical protein